MIPVTRKDHYLNEIVGWGDTAPEKPYIEEEFFFAEILGEAVQAPEPLTRYQMYLAKIAGRNIEIPYPEVRLEYFLARAAGMDVETPVPITREEIYWSNYTAIVEFEVEGVPPLTYKAVEGTLENYRIYGNTQNGESVGDRTKNLLQNTATSQTIKGVTFTVNSDGSITCNGTATAITTLAINIGEIPNGIYIVSGCPNNGAYNTYRIDIRTSGNTTLEYNSEYVVDTGNGHLFDSTDAHSAVIRINTGYTCNNLTFYPMIRKADIEDDTYEPYGYKVPVTVSDGTDTLTIPIYLPEQIKKVGDEAEYIDYGEQKLHRVGAEDIDVTLPVLPTVTGTNVLSVGTEVQPSKVYIKGQKEREYS